MLGLFGAIISAFQMYPILIFCEYFTIFALVSCVYHILVFTSKFLFDASLQLDFEFSLCGILNNHFTYSLSHVISVTTCAEAYLNATR